LSTLSFSGRFKVRLARRPPISHTTSRDTTPPRHVHRFAAEHPTFRRTSRTSVLRPRCAAGRAAPGPGGGAHLKSPRGRQTGSCCPRGDRRGPPGAATGPAPPRRLCPHGGSRPARPLPRSAIRRGRRRRVAQPTAVS
jgi:hypothetical protein